MIDQYYNADKTILVLPFYFNENLDDVNFPDSL